MDGLFQELPACFAHAEGISFKAGNMADLLPRKSSRVDTE